jgi:hypothetical protein
LTMMIPTFISRKLHLKLSFLWLILTSVVEGFGILHSQVRVIRETRLHSTRYDIEAASNKLTWETLEESSSRPVLNLSSRDDSPEDTVSEIKDTPEWDEGQRWQITEDGLSDIGVEKTDSFLEKCPQLLRLKPSVVLETADWVVKEFSVEYLVSEPRLLRYRSVDVSYGLEFMSTMMMMNAKPACMGAPELLLTGIEGGIQEQAVYKALGDAADATSKASQTIAGDAMASLKSLQKQRRKGL